MTSNDHTHPSKNTTVSGGDTPCTRHRVCNPKQSIEKRLYHIFKKHQGKEKIKVADILEELYVTDLYSEEYRSIKYSFESLFKACVLKKTKQIKFQTQVVKYLTENKKEARQLGIKKDIPDRRTFNHFIKNKTKEETRILIDFTANKIAEIADKFSIDLDIVPKVEKAKKTPARSTYYRKKKQKSKRLAKLLKKKISKFMHINLPENSENCKYSKNDHLNLLLYMAQKQDFAENGSNTLDHKGKLVPDADTLLYYLKQYDNIEELQNMYINIFERVWELAQKQNLFPPRRKYDIAIDFTDWFFYGDKQAPMVVGKKPERGTDRCYRFATVTIVEADRRFTLLALPVGGLTQKKDILEELLKYTKQRIQIRKVYMDKGFFTGDCIQQLNRLNVKFLIPCTSNSRIKKLIETMPAPSVITGYEMTGASFNVVIVKDDKENSDKTLAFASNENWNEDDMKLPQRICGQYRKRWGIETSYRVKKYSFRPKTTSKNYFIRLFYFLFSTLLYNLWILLDILLCLVLHGEKFDEHVITSKLFSDIFYEAGVG